MQILAQLALIVLCLLMFKVDRKYKLAILLLSAICFNCVRIYTIPFGLSKYIVCFSFLLSEIPYVKKHIRDIKRTILKPLIFSVIIAAILLAINSPHYDNFSQYIRLVINELLAKYFIICYAFFAISKEEDLRPIFRVSYYALLVLTIFAVLNYVTKSAFFVNEMYKGMVLTDVMQDSGNKFTYSERFRVQAMFFNPFDYGYICILLLLFNWYGYLKHIIPKKRFYIIIGCCLWGVITCGCRTNLLCCLLGIFAYTLFIFNLKKRIKYLTIFIFIGTLSAYFIPFFSDRMNEIISLFDKKSSITGSSIEMRLLQYATVWSYVKDHIFFGRGLDFFFIDLGWKDGKEYLIDQDLFGLEGVLMNYLLERGIVGVSFYLFFYIYLLIFFYKHRSADKHITTLGLSILTVYLAFANMTGELSSVFPTLLILGICLKILYISLFSNNTNYKDEIQHRNTCF